MTDQTYRSDRISAPGVGWAQTSVKSHSWFEKVQPWTVGRAVRLNPTYTTKSSKAHNLVKPGSSSHGESVWGETMVRIIKGLWWEFSYTAIPTRSSTPHQKVINNLCSVKTEGHPPHARTSRSSEMPALNAKWNSSHPVRLFSPDSKLQRQGRATEWQQRRKRQAFHEWGNPLRFQILQSQFLVLFLSRQPSIKNV